MIIAKQVHNLSRLSSQQLLNMRLEQKLLLQAGSGAVLESLGAMRTLAVQRAM